MNLYHPKKKLLFLSAKKLSVLTERLLKAAIIPSPSES